MRIEHKVKQSGFGLIELMLVLVIISGMILMTITYMAARSRNARIDKTAAQMQQILNAGLSYHIDKGSWPANITALQTDGYLPPGSLRNPWGNLFFITSAPIDPKLQIMTFITRFQMGNDFNQAMTAGNMIAGKLPMSFTVDWFGVNVTTLIYASVDIPGQNLNNVANLPPSTGIYRNGACVPAPTCPVVAGVPYEPKIVVSPISVSGMNEPNTVYPIVSYTARAIGDASGAPVVFPAPGSIAPCGNQSVNVADTTCWQDMTPAGVKISDVPAGMYWRVCLDATTAKGKVTWNLTTGQYATVMAVTRCVAPAEPVGSGFNVWAW